MTTPLDRPYSFVLYAIGIGALRTIVATPLDAIEKREAIQSKEKYKNSLQVMRGMTRADFLKGFQPTAIKHIGKTPLQALSMTLSSSIVPTSIDPSTRGAGIGFLKGVIESVVSNGLGAVHTRFIQGGKWNIILQERYVLFKGFTPSFIHRTSSSVIFFSAYEKCKAAYPSQLLANSLVAGVVQVILTSPLYIAAVHQQSKDAAPAPFYEILKTRLKTQGIARGVFLPALAPRLAHSAITSPLVMGLMEKFDLIRR